MKKVLTIFVGSIHDFAIGCWAATVLAAYRLEVVIHEPETQPSMAALQREFFLHIGLISIAVVFAAGAGRMFT